MVRYLDLADYLLIAEATTGIAAETLQGVARVHLAESTSLLEFVERNGRSWRKSPHDPDETVQIMEAVAANEITEPDLAQWIRGRLE